ncbi:MAG TPA: glutamate ABC transporter substrate-binding protein [Acidimicrobiales bacterium]|jgi:glutamate transport system substrate-binding protein|nr:glutamate ABC transporter substrate-binding protein [Acidimicrobiales bacterium]
MRSRRSTRLWTVPVLVLAAGLVASACGSSSKKATSTSTTPATAPPTFPAGTTMANIQAKGKMVVGIKFDQPGVGLRNPTNNSFEGFDVDIAKLMAVGIFGGSPDTLGNKIEFVEAVSANRETFIENGNVDAVIASYTINDARKQRVDFAGPYLLAHQDILVKASDTTIKSVTDLNGKKVCSVQGSTSEKNVIAKAPQAQLLSFDDYSKCTEALTDGRVVAVTTDGPILAGYVAKSNGAFKVVNAPFTDEPYGIGMKKGDDAFRAFLNDRLEKIEADGQWASAFQATLGKLGLALPTPPPIDRYVSGGSPSATTSTTATGGATSTTKAAGATTTAPTVTTTVPATTSTSTSTP